MSFDDAKSYVSESLHEAAGAAEGSDVYLCIETHDAYCLADDLMEVVTMADHEHVKVCWDIMHPVTHGMSMAEAFEHVKDHVLHCHIHDGIRPNDPEQTSWDMCPTGEGDIPHDEAVELLATIDFDGALSGEWFTEFDPDEILPQNVSVLTDYIVQTRNV
jgi:sugar phosphate isomerase/epimerase